MIDAYADGLRREVRGAVAAGLPPATSVFFGGGTPSLLSPAQLRGILELLPLAPGAEVSVECNPDTVDARRLDAYRSAGVNRISLGGQSMVPTVLAALGRSHDAVSVVAAAEAVVGAGFPSWNLDVIYGAVGETLEDWQATLDAALALGPPHVSAYGLTVEPGTPLAEDPARRPDDDDQADKYLMAEATLRHGGLGNYEISNWSRPGHQCRHNLCYWSQGDYRGFGCAAHSHAGGRRWWNVRTPERYLALLGTGQPVVAGDEHLDACQRRLERLQLALRTSDGVPAEALDTEGLEGLLEGRDDRLVLTVTGRLLANEVAMHLW